MPGKQISYSPEIFRMEGRQMEMKKINGPTIQQIIDAGIPVVSWLVSPELSVKPHGAHGRQWLAFRVIYGGPDGLDAWVEVQGTPYAPSDDCVLLAAELIRKAVEAAA